MLGKTPRLTPLEVQKQLLIAESEINRIQLLQDWEVMEDGVSRLGRRVKSVRTFASVAALVTASLAASWRRVPKPPAGKRSWFQNIVKGARLACSIWLAFRERSRNRGDETNSENESVSQKSVSPRENGSHSNQPSVDPSRRNRK